MTPPQIFARFWRLLVLVLSLRLTPQVPAEALSADRSQVAAAAARAQAERDPRRRNGESTREGSEDRSTSNSPKALINYVAKKQRVKG